MKRNWKLGLEAMMVAAALVWSGAALACSGDKDDKEVKADKTDQPVAMKKASPIEATVAFTSAMPKAEEYGPAWSNLEVQSGSDEGSR